VRKLLIAAAAAVICLVVPAGAAAKELSSATICGESGCRTIDRPNELLAGGGDGIPEPAPAASPYYAVRLTTTHEGREEAWTIFYVPGPAMLGFRSERDAAQFEQLEGPVVAAWRAAARGVDPFPAPRITSAAVDGEPVADPQSYLSLYGRTDEGAAYPAEPDFVPIVLHAARPSPWTDLRYVMFSPSAGAVELGTRIVKLPEDTTAAIVARESLDDPSSSRGFAWPAVSFGLASALVLTLAAALLARRSRRAAPA
jgi:hypothetical protein